MIQSPRGGETRVLAIALVAAAVLAVIVAMAVSTRQAERDSGTNTTVSNVSNTNADPAALWATYFYRPFRVSVKFPPGMQICEQKESGFEFRSDQCGSTTKAAFAFRRSEAWTTMDPVAAFNDAFGQELRELGLSTIEGNGTKEAGNGTVIIRKTFSNEFSGALVAEAEGNRRVAADIRAADPLIVNDLALDREQIVATVLKNVRFTTAAKIEQPSP